MAAKTRKGDSTVKATKNLANPSIVIVLTKSLQSWRPGWIYRGYWGSNNSGYGKSSEVGQYNYVCSLDDHGNFHSNKPTGSKSNRLLDATNLEMGRFTAVVGPNAQRVYQCWHYP